ncbi:ribonuclease III [Comamonas piscis]|uniref:Ribonuclease 3 n=1 Tax=Comamonas piscis TaxID=1562974 RepID=A0A7G5EFF9_9BURK|nr:ribonuclease III [Comamonas piscis]QMV72734.1 ribonuclease III [Comamonas piscis]WSO35508.1 ribonuclease III [Comamonas piscis]
MEPELSRLQERLQYSFANGALLQRAVTHRSFCADHNERLEFLGDSVLGLAVSTMLFQQLKGTPEGELSRMRANLVKQDTLHQIALRLQLAKVLRLGEGESKSGGRERPSILADAVEAIIGAVYLDAGYTQAEAIVHHLYERVEISQHMSAASKDAKTALQEWLQARKKSVPEYVVTGTTGAAHAQTFHVDCVVPAFQARSEGAGASRRAAEQAAAAIMLQQLQTQHR